MPRPAVPARPGVAVPKAATPDVAKTAKATPEAPKAPVAKVAGNFGQWALICGEVKDEAGKEPCSLVQALVEHNSQKLVFRLTVAYGPKGNLVLRIDSPNGVALQKGLEFSPDAVKIYRLPFQTCLAQGCSALLVMADDLKQDLHEGAEGHDHGLCAERPGGAGGNGAQWLCRRSRGARQTARRKALRLTDIMRVSCSSLPILGHHFPTILAEL